MTWFNGWMNVFFPYLKDNQWNNYCVQYDPNHLPTVPVIWKYYDNEIRLLFQSGFIGATQSSTTLEITPNVGWVIVK